MGLLIVRKLLKVLKIFYPQRCDSKILICSRTISLNYFLIDRRITFFIVRNFWDVSINIDRFPFSISPCMVTTNLISFVKLWIQRLTVFRAGFDSFLSHFVPYVRLHIVRIFQKVLAVLISFEKQTRISQKPESCFP